MTIEITIERSETIADKWCWSMSVNGEPSDGGMCDNALQAAVQAAAVVENMTRESYGQPERIRPPSEGM